MNETVLVGMSGGVDSSVAAALLQKQGYNVIGFTLNLWSGSSECKSEKVCCSLTAVEDARRVCDKLGIQYYVFNYKELFKEQVIDYFIKEYLKGSTPNPCIACNRFLKFGAILERARAIGAKHIATGHYAVIEKNEDTGRYILKRSNDITKDQTYVLYGMTQEQLAATLMPLGGYNKAKVRQIAAELGLNVANKPDSQDICFVEDGDHGRFIKEYSNIKIPGGNFVNSSGEILGRHSGIVNYTIGQRRGLGIGGGKRLYVTDINADTNNVVLGDNEELFSKVLYADDINLIAFEALKEPMSVTAKIRYSTKDDVAIITPIKDGLIRVEFERPQRAATPGQAVVFYDGDIVIGGGTIIKSK